MAVHKLEDRKPRKARKARKARRNGARARTSVANGAHSKKRRKARRNGSAVARKPRGKRIFHAAARKVRRRRNGVSSSSLTNTGKPIEMILTAGAGALGAVAVGALAQGLVGNMDYFRKPENATVRNALPGLAAAAAGLGIARFSKSKGGKTAGAAMALAGAVIFVKDIAGSKVTELVNNVLPKDKQAGQPAGYEALAGYKAMGAFGHSADSGMGGFLLQNGQVTPDVGQAGAMFQGY